MVAASRWLQILAPVEAFSAYTLVPSEFAYTTPLTNDDGDARPPVAVPKCVAALVSYPRCEPVKDPAACPDVWVTGARTPNKAKATITAMVRRRASFM